MKTKCSQVLDCRSNYPRQSNPGVLVIRAGRAQEVHIERSTRRDFRNCVVIDKKSLQMNQTYYYPLDLIPNKFLIRVRSTLHDYMAFVYFLDGCRADAALVLRSFRDFRGKP